MLICWNDLDWYKILDVLSKIGVFIGLCFTAYQLSINRKTEKAKFFKDLYWQFLNDDKIQKAFYQIEYNELRYAKDFHGSDIEKEIDKLLGFFDILCELYYKKFISKEDIQFLHYEMKRVYRDTEIQKYLEFLKTWYKNNEINKEPWSSYLQFMKESEQNI